MADYDVVVLGAGPGGYVAAIRAAQLGKKVAVVELKYWGGVCLNVGCIPSKALLRNAEIAHIITAEKKVFGIEGDATMAFGPTHARSRAVADASAKGVHYLMKKNKIDEIDGWGVIASPTSLDVTLADTTRRTVTFDNLIIATGAVTRLVPGTSLSERVVTYEEQILTDQLPGSIIIAGSGAIGVEFAYVMTNFGVDVTIVEFLDRMVPTEDPDVSKELLKQYKKLGVKVLLSTKVESIDDSGEKVKVTVSPAKGGDQQVLEADKVLQAIGFAPRVEGFGLESVGVAADRPRSDRRRRARPHQHRGDLRHRRRHREADARAYRRGHGHRGGRDDRRRRDRGDQLRHDPASDVLPAADRLVRLHRGAGPRARLRRQDSPVPVLRQRKGAGDGRGRGLRQDRRGRRAQRDRRRPHDRTRGDRAAARR